MQMAKRKVGQKTDQITAIGNGKKLFKGAKDKAPDLDIRL